MKSNLPHATALATFALALAPSAAHAIPICENGDPCPTPPAEKVHHVGKFNGGGKKYLEVRAAPYSNARVIRRVRSGTKALIVCQANGSPATGPYGTSTLWDKLKKGGYISDTRVYTGSDGRVAPDCTNVPAPPPAADVFKYDDPGAWNGPSSCSGGFTAGAATLRGWLQRHYGFTRSIGGYACRPNSADSSQVSLHGEGRALDWMASWYKPAQRRAVNRFIARVAASNFRLGRAMGIQELIWNKRIWTASSPGAWRTYTGPNPHTDHIHVGLNRAGAAKQTSFYR